MLGRGHKNPQKYGIILSVLVAVVLHAILLLMPLSPDTTATPERYLPIELRFSQDRQEERQTPLTMAAAEPVLEPVPDNTQPIPAVTEKPLENNAQMPASEVASTNPVASAGTREVTEEDNSHLTRSILSRQYISEESVTDQLFGIPLEIDQATNRSEFHFPARQNLIAMLDQPMQDLPFEYTPGLIRFAYDPGIKGDLQRFWDDITPEFGWITNNGTEFKCVWVLVVVGCAWKQN